MTVAPDPVFPTASGGVMAEIGKEASCERGSGAEVVHTSAKDANRRDEIQEIPMTDTDVSGRLSNGELADLLVRLAREPETHEMKDWPKWKPYILAKLTEAADRLRSPGGGGELVAALRDMPCIRPCNGRPDDFTVGQCCDAGECGCGNAAALSAAEATSAPTPAPVSGPVSDVEGVPAFCEKYCHEGDHWCMRKAGRQCRTALRTPHQTPPSVPTDEMVEVLKRIRDTAMEHTLAARIPECGVFGGIAQDADWLMSELTAAMEASAK